MFLIFQSHFHGNRSRQQFFFVNSTILEFPNRTMQQLNRDSGVYLWPYVFVLLCPAAFSYMLYPALSLLAVGGLMLLLTNMQVITPVEIYLSRSRYEPHVFLSWWSVSLCDGKVGNLFPAHRSTIITFYNGAFDSSSAVFLFIKVKLCSHISGFVHYYDATCIFDTFICVVAFISDVRCLKPGCDPHQSH